MLELENKALKLKPCKEKTKIKEIIRDNKITQFVISALIASTLLFPKIAKSPEIYGNGATENPRIATKSLIDLMQNVPSIESGAVIYSLRDNQNHTMDCIKVINDPNGGYFGTYHYLDADNVFKSALGWSKDLIHWNYVRELKDHASMPYVIKPKREINGQLFDDEGYLVALEIDNHKENETANTNINMPALLYYKNKEELLNPQSKPKELFMSTFPSRNAAGTPHIESATFSEDGHSKIVLGAHYFEDGRIDQQIVIEVTDFQETNRYVDKKTNQQFKDIGYTGKLGKRDNFLFENEEYVVYEVQKELNNWETWRWFLMDKKTNQLFPINFRTRLINVSFSNPNITILTLPNGKKGICVSVFIPSDNRNPLEAGQMLFYKELN